MAKYKESNKDIPHATERTRRITLFKDTPNRTLKNGIAAKIIAQHLEEKKIGKKSEFIEKGKKGAGDTAGYRAARITDNHDVMIKSAPKDLQDIIEGQVVANFTELVDEYVAAPLFKRALYDRAPVVEMVVEDYQLPETTAVSQKPLKPDTSGDIMIRSKFIDAFDPLTAVLYKPAIEIDGTEKVISACIKCGDVDFHGDNLSRKMEKIDHGKAFHVAFTNEQILRQELVSSFKEFGYTKINFNFEKLITALEQQNQITREEDERMIDTRYAMLKDAGVKFNNPGKLTCYSENHGILIDLRDLTATDQYETVKATSKKVVNLNTNTLNDLLQTLRIIAKIEGVGAQWKDKQWLYDMEGKDPIIWAALQEKKIAGQDPIKWAIDNGKQLGLLESDNTIKYIEPLAWAAKNKIRIEHKDPTAWAIENNLMIEGTPPLAWALKNNLRIDGKDPIQWAALNAMPFTQNGELMDPYQFAVINRHTIDGRDAVIWCLANNQNIAGEDPIAFLKTTGRDVTEEYSILEKIYRNEKLDDKDAATYARDEGLTLEGYTIPEWSVISNTRIAGEDPVIWSLKNNITDIAGQHPVLYAQDKGHLVEDKPVLLWAIESGIKIDDKVLATWLKQQSTEAQESLIKSLAACQSTVLIDGQHPVAWGVNNNIKLDGVIAYLWADKNNIQVHGESALLWAAKHDNQEISAHALNTAITKDLATPIATFDWIKWAANHNKNIFHTECNFSFEPVIYALFSNLKIDKMNALAWSLDNERKIDGAEPIQWIRENSNEENVKDSIKASVMAGEKVKEKEIALWLHENNFQIDGKNPIAWAVENNVKISGKNAALTASELGIRLETQATKRI
jgi:hypothetical protein